MIAREKGLEPLALLLLEQNGTDPQQAASDFVDLQKNVETIEDALAGARDIIAEIINEDQNARSEMRKLFDSRAIIHSRVATGKEADGTKYQDYFDWQEAAAAARAVAREVPEAEERPRRCRRRIRRP